MRVDLPRRDDVLPYPAKLQNYPPGQSRHYRNLCARRVQKPGAEAKFTWIMPSRSRKYAICVQGERRRQVYLDYAEPQPQICNTQNFNINKVKGQFYSHFCHTACNMSNGQEVPGQN